MAVHVFNVRYETYIVIYEPALLRTDCQFLFASEVTRGHGTSFKMTHGLLICTLFLVLVENISSKYH